MSAVAEVEALLVEALSELARRCPAGPGDRVTHVVRDFVATSAVRCETLAAATVVNPGEFAPDVFKTFKTLARDAIGRDRSPRRAVVTSLQALGDDDRRPSALRWLAGYALDDIDGTERAYLASLSISWLARLGLTLGDPDMTGWRGGPAPAWRLPESGLRLEARIDAISGEGTVVLVPPAGEAGVDKAAYAAVVWAVATGQWPPAVLLVDPSRRQVRSMDLSELVDRGVRTAEVAARVVVDAGPASGGTDHSDSGDRFGRSPHWFTCRDCPVVGACGPGSTLLAAPLRTRGGIRVLPA